MAKKKKSNKLIFWLLGAFVVLIVALIGLRSAGVIGKPKQDIVQTDKSQIRTIYARVTESGTIQPTIEVPVAPDVSGEVVFLGVKEGARVKKGDLLVTIQPDDYRSLLEQSQASLSQSRSNLLQMKANVSQAQSNLLQDSINFERNKLLFQDKVISQLDLENARLRFNLSKSQHDAAKFNQQAAYYAVQNAEASVKQARQNLDRTNIYASMDGTITSLGVELGQRVVGTRQMAGTEILKIANLSSMEVVVEVNENDIINVNLGDSSKIEVDAFPGKSFHGKVTEIAYSAKVAGQGSTDQVTNFEVTVVLEPESYKELAQAKDLRYMAESPFRPGMTSLVEIYTQSVENAVVVPISAVTLSRGGTDTLALDKRKEVVFVVENGEAKEVPIVSGISDDNFIEVKEGLQKDVEVVTGPYNTLTNKLKSGAKVMVSNKDKNKEPAKTQQAGGR